MNITLRLVSALAALALFSSARAEIVKIDTPQSSLVLKADKGKKLTYQYYGARISDAETAQAVAQSGTPNRNAYPDYGMITEQETAIAATHVDGNMSLDLRVDGVEQKKTDDGDLTIITLRDSYYPFEVKVNYLVRPGHEIIETWTEVSHKEKGTVTLTQFASGTLPVRYGDVWMSSLHGCHNNETLVTEEPLKHGMKVIKNKDGVRNSQTAHGEVMISLDGKPRELSGRVIGAALCYSGNYKLRMETDQTNYHQLFAGINEENSAYKLKNGEVFTTPRLALSYSNEGMSGVSRNFHRWGREHMLHNGTGERKILLNSWEGVYFDIKEEQMDEMMAGIADLGGELFVMDDGWFGVKYPRNNGTSSLGDWIVDTRKLPHGIQGLIDAAKKHGIKFGIWIEPEMINSLSELYEKHPEYVIKPTHREPLKGRGGTQMVLDLSNPKVQDLVFEVVDTLLTKYPELDYIKWDANCEIKNHGSQYLPADKQSHLYIEYHRGLEKALNRIRAKYPNVTIQACASGGGRVNYGFLPWFDEFWTSDNTDALQRVYMQWGTSYFYPPTAMASHISASPNHQTQRLVPIKFRADVAMAGRLGMEMQPKQMTEEEKAIVRRAVADYKRIRPILQEADIYRLLSPFDNKGAASLMYVSPKKDKAVFYWYRTANFDKVQLPRITMAGLDPERVYTVTELNPIDDKPLKYEGQKFTGKFLMDNGLEIPVKHSGNGNQHYDFSSRVLLLE